MIVTGVDIETTGLDQSKGHRIIEFGASVYQIKSRNEEPTLKGHYVKRINPMRKIDKAAELVHGISLHDLKDAPEWEEVAPAVSKILKASSLIVAHNVEFDIPFLVFELDRLGLPLPEGLTFCTMENGRGCTALGKLPNLGELCFAMGVPYDPEKAHAAHYDTDCMMQAFWKGVFMGEFDLPELNE